MGKQLLLVYRNADEEIRLRLITEKSLSEEIPCPDEHYGKTYYLMPSPFPLKSDGPRWFSVCAMIGGTENEFDFDLIIKQFSCSYGTETPAFEFFDTIATSDVSIKKLFDSLVKIQNRDPTVEIYSRHIIYL